MSSIADDERIDPRIKSMLGKLTFPPSPVVTNRSELRELIRSGELLRAGLRARYRGLLLGMM